MTEGRKTPLEREALPEQRHQPGPAREPSSQVSFLGREFNSQGGEFNTGLI